MTNQNEVPWELEEKTECPQHIVQAQRQWDQNQIRRTPEGNTYRIIKKDAHQTSLLLPNERKWPKNEAQHNPSHKASPQEELVLAAVSAALRSPEFMDLVRKKMGICKP
jgi:hypothetical protein